MRQREKCAQEVENRCRGRVQVIELVVLGEAIGQDFHKALDVASGQLAEIRRHGQICARRDRLDIVVCGVL